MIHTTPPAPPFIALQTAMPEEGDMGAAAPLPFSKKSGKGKKCFAHIRKFLYTCFLYKK